MTEITLTSAQMAIWLTIYRESTICTAIVSQMEEISQFYPNGIPEDCENSFDLQIHASEKRRIIGAINKAIKMTTEKTKLSTFKTQMESLLNAA
jgi:hypothetical protein